MQASIALAEMAASARASIQDPDRITVVGGATNPRFELFHASSSLCSQKVRAVLQEKSLAYRSNDMLILSSMGPQGLTPAEHYSADYVRLRLRGARALGFDFVNGYSGRMSVETEGIDPCVVPLLVDLDADRVIVDSKLICTYLDAVSHDPIQLVPDEPGARAEVMRQVSIVDKIPNGALLYGFHPDDDRRPQLLIETMRTVYDYKIMALEKLVAQNADEPDLVAAFLAKIAKESGGKRLCTDAQFQRSARKLVEQLIAELNQDIAVGSFSLLKGHRFSLADLVWGINLIRLNYLGLSSLWNDHPLVREYFDMLVQRPSLCAEAIAPTVTSMPRSHYMNRIACCGVEWS